MLFSNHLAFLILQHETNVNLRSPTGALPAVLVHPVDFLLLALPAQIYY